MASAIAIENAGRKGDKEELDKQIDFAYEHLKFDSIRIVSVQLENLSAVKKEVEEKWGSLLELSMNYPTDISLHHQELQDIYQALGEALANSFRHGEATSAWILIEKSKDGIRVHVTDNGKGVGNFKPGLGSEYFNVIAGNSWSLKNADNQQGATLSLFLKGVGVSGDK
jgi:K+-sensing histidine kinase KdpD